MSAINYNVYRAAKNLSNSEVIRVIRTRYPKYTKVSNSFVNNAETTGVCLLPEAEKLLVNTFGNGPGLSAEVERKQKNHDNKDKPHRYCVRLSEEMNERVEKTMKYLCFATKQDFLEAAITQMCNRYGGET